LPRGSLFSLSLLIPYIYTHHTLGAARGGVRKWREGNGVPKRDEGLLV